MAKKRKLNMDGSSDTEAKVCKLGSAGDDVPPPRRSSRVRQSKNSAKPFTVSSSDTLHDLKIKVDMFYAFSNLSFVYCALIVFLPSACMHLSFVSCCCLVSGLQGCNSLELS